MFGGKFLRSRKDVGRDEDGSVLRHGLQAVVEHEHPGGGRVSRSIAETDTLTVCPLDGRAFLGRSAGRTTFADDGAGRTAFKAVIAAAGVIGEAADFQGDADGNALTNARAV